MRASRNITNYNYHPKYSQPQIHHSLYSVTISLLTTLCTASQNFTTFVQFILEIKSSFDQYLFSNHHSFSHYSTAHHYVFVQSNHHSPSINLTHHSFNHCLSDQYNNTQSIPVPEIRVQMRMYPINM